MKYTVLFDNSGSMKELGKERIILNALRYIKLQLNINNHPLNLSFFEINNSIQTINFEKNYTEFTNQPYGTCDAKIITEWFLQHSENAVLWLTDGYCKFSNKEIDQISQHGKTIIIPIGCDADAIQLKRFKVPIFHMENISTALSDFLLLHEPGKQLPKIVKIDSSIQENEDEW